MQLIDHYPLGWVKETQAMIGAWLAESPTPYIYFLLDASFRHDTLLTLIRDLWPKGNWCSLYQDAANTSERVLAVSPLLLTMDNMSLDLLPTLAEEISGQPMLSVIVTTESMDALWQRLSNFRIVTVQDARYVLRLSDTRRLPQIAEMLTNEQRFLLTKYMTAWRYVGRDAGWRELDLEHGAVTTAEPNPASSVRLDDRQTQMLLDMNHIDALIDGLRRNEPALHDAFQTPSRRYQWVVGVLDDAALSDADYPDQVQCCRAAAMKEGWLT
ncbi:DUF4123 domain-containing protein [Salinicola aestuarinus]|uniref:DUF4123 domain-containing protein n=1 Tax=Salinicola aestuarinus TaxID=1949082 RepID=UPI001300A5C0|nr:DUF4123 domain-containing protein [Salinicola aestuarinus]